MTVVIGNERIKAESNITIMFTNNSTVIIDGEQTKFLYINPDMVKTVVIDEKKKTY